NYALLIGVSGYPSLPVANRLEGPRNDVVLLRDVLSQHGLTRDNIRVLADGVPGAEEPTRARIMEALGTLADKVRRDDFVFVSFSGHGSQQPDDPENPNRKPDGLSSTILPIDIGKWSGPAKSVENAITDHQFGAALNKIRANGAFVWAVLDSCHSGMMTRGGEVGRSVSPAELGVPADALQKAASDAASSRSRGVGEQSEFDISRNPAAHVSGIAGFFAAQSYQEAPEMALPPANAEQKPYGLFTFTLAHLIEQYPHITYEQLDQRIRQEYGRLNRSFPTPLALGELTARIFGAQPGPEIRQWQIEIGAGGPEIAAGNVHGLGPGSVLAVLPEPTSDLSAAIGYVEVKSATAFRSRLQPVAHEGKAPPASDEIKPGSYARLVQAKLNLELTVSRPPELTKPSAREQALWQAVQSVAISPANRAQLRWLGPDDPADARLRIAHDKLWFLPSGSTSPEDLSGIPFVEAAGSIEDTSSRIAEGLFKIARVHTLLELGTALRSSEDLGIEVALSLRRANYGEAPRPPDCADRELEKPVALGLSALPELRQCDEVDIQIRNVSDAPIDVTVLYIDSAYGVTALYPKESDEGNRIVSSGIKKLPIEIRTLDAKGRTTTTGTERVIFFAVKGRPGHQMASFRFLEQPSLPVTRSEPLQKRGLEAASLIELLEQAVYEPTRGPPAVLQNQIADSAISIIDWAIQPEPAAASGDESRRIGP
ncbi:MAG: caspase family protein, partial [Stellaceae bacterium]